MEQEIRDLGWAGHSLGIGLGRTLPSLVKPRFPYLGTASTTDLSQGTMTDNGSCLRAVGSYCTQGAEHRTFPVHGRGLVPGICGGRFITLDVGSRGRRRTGAIMRTV